MQLPSPSLYFNDIKLTRKDSAREQRKPCIKCHTAIAVGSLYILSIEQNRFGHEQCYYWHWKCWTEQLLTFLNRAQVQFGGNKRLIKKVVCSVRLLE